VRVAIDDFGTGYSSLAHLQRFPVDALKIDRSFISRLGDGGENGVFLRSLVQLGKALQIETLAEGIERADELSLIREENCDSGQGFLFARPLEAGAVLAFLSDWDQNAPDVVAARSASATTTKQATAITPISRRTIDSTTTRCSSGGSAPTSAAES
jgi:sensor c-di-GMP phosphodiesterase-like protein